jgi:hypothetical protein
VGAVGSGDKEGGSGGVQSTEKKTGGGSIVAEKMGHAFPKCVTHRATTRSFAILYPDNRPDMHDA